MTIQSLTGPARWLAIGLVLLATGHLLQVFSPLRLNHDAVRLLSMAWSAHETGSYEVRGSADQYPTGYPFMVRVLLDAGMGRTLWLNLISLGWLAVASASTFVMARRQFQLTSAASLIVVCAPLLSWVTIKHAILPLSDIPYLGISMLSLLLLQRFWLSQERLAWESWIIALLLAFAALHVRTIGLALVASVVMAVIMHPRVLNPLLSRNHRWVLWLTGSITVGATAVMLGIVTHTHWFQTQFLYPDAYFRKLTTFLSQDGGGPTFFDVVCFRLREIAEVGLNGSLGLAWAPLYIPLGIGGVFLLAWVSVQLWVSHRPLVLYLGLSAIVLLFWPFSDSRFLLPLLPVGSILIGSAFAGWMRIEHWKLRLTMVWLSVYTLLGLVALGYSARLTVAGAGFAQIYSWGDYQLTYRYAFGLEPTAPLRLLDKELLITLKRFEPLAAPRVRPAP